MPAGPYKRKRDKDQPIDRMQLKPARAPGSDHLRIGPEEPDEQGKDGPMERLEDGPFMGQAQIFALLWAAQNHGWTNRARSVSVASHFLEVARDLARFGFGFDGSWSCGPRLYLRVAGRRWVFHARVGVVRG